MTAVGAKKMLRFGNELFSVITVLASVVSLGACGDGVGVNT